MIVRRRLFAYTIMLTAGISAGFFIFERERISAGTILLITISVLIYMFSTAASDRPANKSGSFPDTYMIIAVLAAGFLIFTCRFIHYERILSSSLASEDEVLSGLTESAVMTERGIRLTVAADGKGQKVQVYYYGENHPVPEDLIGRRVTAHGSFREPQTADNPGCFDYRTYLRSKGIGCTFRAQNISTDSECEKISVRGTYIRHLFLLRERFLKQFRDREIQAFVKGVVFGDKSQIDEDIRDDFNSNGTGHILAVSGLHTGFLYALLRMLAGRKKTVPVTVITICVLLMYGEMTMWSPSTVRAVTVLSISMLSIYAGRPFDLLSSVSASAFVILLYEPYQLFSSGFQMSFAALLGIAFLAGPLSVFTGEYLSVMIAVQAGVAPLTAFIFHRLNILSVLINVPVIFIASVLVPVCMIALILTALTGSDAGLLITVIEGLAEITVRLNSAASHGGFFSNLVTSCNAGIVICFYLVLLLISSEWCRVKLIRREKIRILAALACILIVSLEFGVLTYNRFADDEIVFVSVGQGDCTHIRTEGKDVLIDGGGSTERNTGKDILMPYLLANGAERLEMAIVTHLHTDHCLGILELEQEYPVGSIEIPEDYSRSIEKKRSSRTSEKETDEESSIGSLLTRCDNIRYISEGMRIIVSEDVYIDPVWPLKSNRSDTETDDANENNMVFIVNYKGVRIMVTGDLLEEDELAMAGHYRGTDRLRCDILKVAHHGSKSSTCEEFLDVVSPQIAVIEVGRNNFYGHPHKQTLDRLSTRGIEIYRTDLNGAVGIDIRGSRIRVDTMR